MRVEGRGEGEGFWQAIREKGGRGRSAGGRANCLPPTPPLSHPHPPARPTQPHRSQHIFIDPTHPASDYSLAYNCVACPDNQRTFNDGYHVVHHLNSQVGGGERRGGWLPLVHSSRAGSLSLTRISWLVRACLFGCVHGGQRQSALLTIAIACR